MAKILKERVYPTCVLYTTDIDLSEEEVRSYNEENDTDYDKYELEDKMASWDFEDLMDNLECAKELNNCNTFVVFGSVGTWRGRFEIVPKKFDTLQSAILATLNNTDYHKVVLTKGRIEVEAIHHDGTNLFTIKMLNEKGERTENGDLSNPRYHKPFKGYLF